MEVLTRRRSRALLPLLLVCLAAAGCALTGLFQSADKPFAYSHALHVKQHQLACTDCHSGAENGDEPGMPTAAQCRLCHKDVDANKPPERQVASLFDGRDYRATHASRLADEVVFSHKQHVAAKVACNACHQGIDQNDVVGASLAVRMADCTKCHAQSNTANDCATCHQVIRTDWKPDTHARQWQRLHGQTVRAHSEGLVNQCSLCHQESTCTSCHLDTPPQNHDNYFRLRGHGMYVRLDRQQCSACHRSDSCDSCHRETRPLSHMGSWGGTRSNHCLGCHFPLKDNQCAVCHKATPSHDLAAPLPANHNPAMNCRQCHGLTAPLPHVDKGDQCIQCHR